MNASRGPFTDRREAGLALARALAKLELRAPHVTLGLPRGGVPVAYEVARRLHSPLDVMIVRKIGMPGQPELAIGAVASGGIVVRDPQGLRSLGALDIDFEPLAERQRGEVERREQLYRAGQPALNLQDKTAILVDDGLATGATMLAAVRAARAAGAPRIVVAAPVGSREAHALVGAEADEVVLLQIPRILMAIGEWYVDFEQVEDEEVCRLLALARSITP